MFARARLMVLFVLCGWQKLTGFSGTAGYMISVGARARAFCGGLHRGGFVVGITIVIGFYAHPLAFLLALYTLGIAFMGHHYWPMNRKKTTAPFSPPSRQVPIPRPAQ
ncbi:DoxX family protein [Paraburkholderia adhaesiva]|uniref:DoxX family protein n=1 Tax=Paraburkholderia adhaesiva TaxID=2883244 RepID=UPI0022780A35|nr:DoxX family protein [Paraburkholderia adhaesiva]